MKAALGYGVLILAAWVVFMVLLFPAPALLGLAAQRLPALQVRAVEGSALDGRVEDVRLNGLNLASLDWHFDPKALLKGRLGLRLTAREPQLDLNAGVSVGLNRDLEVGDLQGRLSLPRATTLFRLPPLPLDGELELDLAQLRVDAQRRPLAARGAARLLNARTTLGRSLELGSFRVELTTVESGILGTVGDEGGPLALTGTVTLNPDGDYHFQGEVGTRNGANPQLRQALGILGRPDARGNWRIDYSGRL